MFDLSNLVPLHVGQFINFCCPGTSEIRTSDSLNEGLPIKMAKEKLQRK